MKAYKRTDDPKPKKKGKTKQEYEDAIQTNKGKGKAIQVINEELGKAYGGKTNRQVQLNTPVVAGVADTPQVRSIRNEDLATKYEIVVPPTGRQAPEQLNAQKWRAKRKAAEEAKNKAAEEAKKK